MSRETWRRLSQQAAFHIEQLLSIADVIRLHSASASQEEALRQACLGAFPRMMLAFAAEMAQGRFDAALWQRLQQLGLDTASWATALPKLPAIALHIWSPARIESPFNHWRQAALAQQSPPPERLRAAVFSEPDDLHENNAAPLIATSAQTVEPPIATPASLGHLAASWPHLLGEIAHCREQAAEF
jgi:hypothetical protein